MRIQSWGVIAVFASVCLGAFAADGPRVLFFHKSAGFEHSVVKVENGAPNHVETVIRPLIEQLGGTLESTKDGAVLTAEHLEEVDVVIFYTTEDLCKADASDGSPPAGPDAMMALLDWVKAGGGLIGFHCATDTWHRERNQFAPESPYLDLLGGEFNGHGQQFSGTLRVTDPDHPTMARVKADWQVNDEWYYFKDLQDETMHVLALLDPGDERSKQEKYNIPNYPVIWCSAPGEGRIFYNAMGHREDVWTNPDFQAHIVDALKWAAGAGDADAAPNWAEAAPPELDPVTGSTRAEAAAAESPAATPEAGTLSPRERKREKE